MPGSRPVSVRWSFVTIGHRRTLVGYKVGEREG